MQVGLTTIFQGVEGVSDAEVWRQEIRLAEMAEPLGFDSVWGVEHHFTAYTMCPDVLQFLTYMAGRTRRVQLGSMAVILPWHDPVRVAEQVALIDLLSGGRFIFGMGRGLGRVEFEGFGVPMDESRERFVEAAELVVRALETGVVEGNGPHYPQERRDLRPRPERGVEGRLYAAAVSPESVEIMARLGAGILINPQKEWWEVGEDLANYRALFQDVNGRPAPPPIVAGWVCCHEDSETAQEMAHDYIAKYYESVLVHYELAGRHFDTMNGYEYYAKVSKGIGKVGEDGATKAFVDLQIWGTPDECLERIMDIRSKVGNETFNAVCSFSGMPYDVAESNLKLFASKVMPRLQAEASLAAGVLA